MVTDKVKILRTLINNYISTDSNQGLDAADILTKEHSHIWHTHPDAKRYQKLLELNLDSLRLSGDLIRSGNKYQVTGKAQETIAQYEITKLKYKQNLATQHKMTWLTYAIVFLTVLTTLGTLVQANIIKIATLWDFTK